MSGLNLYIVKCAELSYHTGVAADLDIRPWQHNNDNSRCSYTYSRRPVDIVFIDHFANPIQVIDAEKQVKGWYRAKKEALVAGRFDLLKELARCKNITLHENQISQ